MADLVVTEAISLGTIRAVGVEARQEQVAQVASSASQTQRPISRSHHWSMFPVVRQELEVQRV